MSSPQPTRDELLGMCSSLEKVRVRGRNLTACCPFHDDKNPSFSFDIGTGWFRCWSCSAKGSWTDLVAHLEDRNSREVYLEWIQKNRPEFLGNRALRDLSFVQECVQRLARTEEAQRYLREERCISEGVWRKHRLGLTDRGDYLLPTSNNARILRPGKKPKVLWLRKGVVELIPGVPASQGVTLLEGEFDGLTYETQTGDASWCTPGSASAFREDWGKAFMGKDVTIIFDRDSAGRKGSESVVTALRDWVSSIRVFEWPEDLQEDVKDVCDYFRQELHGHAGEEHPGDRTEDLHQAGEVLDQE